MNAGFWYFVRGVAVRALVIALVLLVMASGVRAASPVSLAFSNVRLPELLRVVFADVLGASFVLDDVVLQSPALVSIELRGLTREQVAARIDDVINRHGFGVERRDGAYLVGARIRPEETSFVYVPVNRSGVWLADVVGSAVRAGRFSRGGGGGVRVGESSGGGGVLVGDALVYTGPAVEAENVKRLLVELDTPVGEVVLKAAVYEVVVRNSEGSALSIAASLLSGRVGVSLGTVIDGARLTVKAGGVSAVLSALGTDDRFKVISRPQVRVRSGGAARFSVGQETPVQGAAVLDRNGNPVTSVTYRESGIILTAKPTVRAGGVQLDITQELSSFGQTTTGVVTSPTLAKRLVETALTLQPGEVVVMAGLDEASQGEHADRLPFIDAVLGRGSDRRTTELIVFVEAQKI